MTGISDSARTASIARHGRYTVAQASGRGDSLLLFTGNDALVRRTKPPDIELDIGEGKASISARLASYRKLSRNEERAVDVPFTTECPLFDSSLPLDTKSEIRVKFIKRTSGSFSDIKSIENVP